MERLRGCVGWPLRLLDAQADWIRRVLTPVQQLRLGALMTDLGLLLCFAVFWTNEPPLIFEMSALALLFGGLGTVVTARLADPDTDDTVPDTD